MKMDEEQQEVMLRKPTPSRPRLSTSGGGGASDFTAASPMSLVANLLDSDAASFSSLLAGAVDNGGKRGDGGNGVIFSSSSSSSSSSFAESLAARNSGNVKSVGMPAPIRPSIARFKSMPPSRLPIPKAAPCVTIPPGLSPTTLLDSPVLLSSSHQPEPSPTTGTFPLPPLLGETKGETKSDQDGSTFVFKPFPKAPPARTSLSPLGNMPPFSFPLQHSIAEQPQVKPHLSLVSATQSPMPPPTVSVEKPEAQKPLPFPEPELNRTVSLSAPAAAAAAPPERSSDDGYNWRKYGQKLVKGSDNPRSYYKCTYVNCPMKKKVERSPDGQVTEIVYEGEHNHPKPQPSRRMAMSAAHLMSKTLPGRNGSTADVSRNQPNGGANGTCEQSSSSASDDDDEPRRKKEKLSRESPPIPRTVREPRVVVQTTSEVDILDDGYRWRKYGQKVVKGNPHPRSYYKCTNLGCPVRKHVERASDDPRAVITTYEGKHNHDVPAARNSSHDRGMELAPQPVPTQSGGSDSAVSIPASVTSPELTVQTVDAESHGNGRLKGEQQEFSTGSPAIISVLPSAMTRPKDEFQQQDQSNSLTLRP